MRRVAVICADNVGERMAGPAIRAIELSRALAQRFDVTLFARTNGSFSSPENLRFVSASAQKAAELAATSDVLIAQGDVLHRWPPLRRGRGALIADLYCPIPLELIETASQIEPGLRWPLADHVASTLVDLICQADHFLCASERQVDFWMGALTVLNKVNPVRFSQPAQSRLADLFTLVPFGMPDVTPAPEGRPLRKRFNIAESELVLLWGGGVYQWLDPEVIVRAISRLTSVGEKAHLIFLGGSHPSGAASHSDHLARLRSTATDLGAAGRGVHFNDGWIPYERRYDYFADADVGVIAHHPSLETRYSFRTRILDYLWAGLPVITTEGDHFAALAQAHGFGRVVGYSSIDGWCQAITELGQPSVRHALAQAARALAGTMSWSRVTEPLLDLCERINPSPDRALVRSSNVALQAASQASVAARIRRAYRRGGIRAIAEAMGRRLRQ